MNQSACAQPVIQSQTRDPDFAHLLRSFGVVFLGSGDVLDRDGRIEREESSRLTCACKGHDAGDQHEHFDDEPYSAHTHSWVGAAPDSPILGRNTVEGQGWTSRIGQFTRFEADYPARARTRPSSHGSKVPS
jgi:hypothetical protein